jgi:hypothetical protein
VEVARRPSFRRGRDYRAGCAGAARGRTVPSVEPSTSGPGAVVDLLQVRRERRLELYRRRLRERAQRAALEALHLGGLLFTAEGSRSGRALLRAQQLVARGLAQVAELSGDGAVPAPRSPERVEAAYRALDTLLCRVDALAGRRTGGLSRLPGGPGRPERRV